MTCYLALGGILPATGGCHPPSSMSILSTTLRVYIMYRGEITIQRKDNGTSRTPLEHRESNDTTIDRHDEASFQSKSAYSLLDFEPSKLTQCTSPDTEPSADEPSATRE